MKLEMQKFDIINYLAIATLEKTGNLLPTEKEITMMEKHLFTSIKISIELYKSEYSKIRYLSGNQNEG